MFCFKKLGDSEKHSKVPRFGEKHSKAPDGKMYTVSGLQYLHAHLTMVTVHNFAHPEKHSRALKFVECLKMR